MCAIFDPHSVGCSGFFVSVDISCLSLVEKKSTFLISQRDCQWLYNVISYVSYYRRQFIINCHKINKQLKYKIPNTINN